MGHRSKINYSQGTCFLVPLRGGGYARGIVARLNGKRGVFGYFFGPKLNAPEEATSRGFDPRQAIYISRFGDASLRTGDWPQVGQVENWNADEWPMPPLVRVDDFTGKATLSYYDDRTFGFIREEDVSPTLVDQYPYDGTMGDHAVEIRLTKLFKEIEEKS